MIKLERNRAAAAIPVSFKGPNLANKAATLIELYYAAQAQGRSMAFDSGAWKPAKGALKRESGGKCAYCEASTETVAHGDVEHFRPKSIYWWLAFCYDNYLFACQLCNQTYKGDNFPMSGLVATAPVLPPIKPTGAALTALALKLTLDAQALTDAHFVGLWSAEAAHLVNPYFEDPAVLFTYEVDVGNQEIWIRSSGAPRANDAISAAETYLGLNRETLRRDRYVAYSMLLVLAQVVKAPTLPAPTRQAVVRQIADMQKRQRPFSGMIRWFAADWGLAPV